MSLHVIVIVLKLVNAVVVVIISMIHVQNCVKCVPDTVKNIKEDAIKDLFGILVIVNVNVINHLMLENI